jgi:hypothetical protein
MLTMALTRLAGLILPFTMAWALACGGSDSSAPGGSTATSCSAAFEREVQCDSNYQSLETEYAAWCEGFAHCLDVMYVPEYTAAYWPCARQLACDEHDDDCGLTVMEARYEDPEIKARVEVCQAKVQNCGTFSDDHCASLLIVKPALLDGLDACFAGPCDQVESCFDAVSKAQGCERGDRPDPAAVPPAAP